MKVKISKEEIQRIIDDPEWARIAKINVDDPWWLIVLKITAALLGFFLAGTGTAAAATYVAML